MIMMVFCDFFKQVGYSNLIWFTDRYPSFNSCTNIVCVNMTIPNIVATNYNYGIPYF